jgi:hypothetical protein
MIIAEMSPALFQIVDESVTKELLLKTLKQTIEKVKNREKPSAQDFEDFWTNLEGKDSE